MSVIRKVGLIALCAIVLGGAAARAQDSSPPSDPLKAGYQDLLNQGYEVKSVLLLSPEVSTRLSNAPQPDTVIAVLQRGPATATCWITLPSWNAHNIGAFPCNLLH